MLTEKHDLVVEIRPAVRRRGPLHLVPAKERWEHTGFTSVYAFPAATAAKIREQRSTKGLAQCSVYSDCLFTDYDNEEGAAEEFGALLRDQGVGFTKWHSGGRSIHYHVGLKPMLGVGVPYSQRQWMAKHAPKADLAIYTHAGLYRLPGTYHFKYPGQRKKLLENNAGNDLEIPLQPQISVTVDPGEGEEGYYRFLGKLLEFRVRSNRHIHAYKICKAALSAGVEADRTRHLLFQWNQTNCHPPKDEWKLTKLLENVYGY